MTALLVIRHAPTDWNEAGLIQGRADRPLSHSGRVRAGDGASRPRRRAPDAYPARCRERWKPLASWAWSRNRSRV
jgi:broad specificity phosphatase PhoE